MDHIPSRTEVDMKYKWRLEDIYSSDALWKEDSERLFRMIDDFGIYRGKLSQSFDLLLEALTKRDIMIELTEKLYAYARMRRDEDNASSVYQALAGEAEELVVKVMAGISFLEPEILNMSYDPQKWWAECPDLEIYRFYLEELFRKKEHILSPKEEEILAMAQNVLAAGEEVFTMLNNVDMDFPKVYTGEGKRGPLSSGRYISYITNTDAKVRKSAFKALHTTYDKYKNTIAACYSANVRSDNFYATVRGYQSALEMSLDEDNISVEVYDKLIEIVDKNIDSLNRYVRLKKKLLGVKSLHLYDLYVPAVKNPGTQYTFEDAKALVLEALKPLGEEYCADAAKAFTDGWIDVCETKNKTSGAYSFGCYGHHPYILLNWQGNLTDVFTLAHELGHAMHTYYSNLSQRFVYSGYKIFVAEVASTVNENLLMKYMLKNSASEEERAYLLNHYLEEFRTTVFRQTMFAEFEKEAHRLSQEGETLTAELMSKIYYDLNCKYYGGSGVVDKQIQIEWARIPHFYSSFYVYKYATGFSAAAALAANIYSGRKEEYLKFLNSGGSDYPLNLLKKAGVDLTDAASLQNAMDVFSETLSEFTELCK